MRTTRAGVGRAQAATRRRVEELTRGTDAGMATAEYAIGTVAAASIASVLMWILKSDWVRELIADLIRRALGLG